MSNSFEKAMLKENLRSRYIYFSGPSGHVPDWVIRGEMKLSTDELLYIVDHDNDNLERRDYAGVCYVRAKLGHPWPIDRFALPSPEKWTHYWEYRNLPEVMRRENRPNGTLSSTNHSQDATSSTSDVNVNTNVVSTSSNPSYHPTFRTPVNNAGQGGRPTIQRAHTPWAGPISGPAWWEAEQEAAQEEMGLKRRKKDQEE